MNFTGVFKFSADYKTKSWKVSQRENLHNNNHTAGKKQKYKIQTFFSKKNCKTHYENEDSRNNNKITEHVYGDRKDLNKAT